MIGEELAKINRKARRSFVTKPTLLADSSNQWRRKMRRKIWVPLLALAAMLMFVAPTHADARVGFGVYVGPSYPGYPYAYSYPYAYPYPGYYYSPYYYPYGYGYGYPAYGYWGGGFWGGHRDRDWGRGFRGGDRFRGGGGGFRGGNGFPGGGGPGRRRANSRKDRICNR